jgi:type 1 glutamine amidotransferase
MVPMTTTRRARSLMGTWIVVSAAVAVTLPPTPGLAQKKNPDGARVLILSGGQRQHHGYREQSLYLAKQLEDTGRYEATICEDAALLVGPSLAKYRIVIGMADRRDPDSHLTSEQQEALFAFVRGGGGYVSIHGADNTPNDLTDDQTREWKDLLGGIYSHKGKPDGKAIVGTYQVKIADTSHPATTGLSDFTLKDELYSNMQMLPEAKPLATIDHAGTTWGVAWARTYGKGRVFHTSLGHRRFTATDADDPIQNANVRRLLLQGIDWVASRPGD